MICESEQFCLITSENKDLSCSWFVVFLPFGVTVESPVVHKEEAFLDKDIYLLIVLLVSLGDASLHA